MRLRPRGRVLHELFDFLELALVEFAALLRHIENIPPGGEVVQLDAEIAEDLFALGEDVIKEEHKDVVDSRSGLPQSFAEVDLAAAVSRHVLDQKQAVAGLDVALDLRVAAQTFRFLAYILHRQHQPIRHPGGEWNASGLAAGDGVELLEADVAQDRRHAKINQRTAHARKRNKAPAIGINRTRPA